MHNVIGTARELAESQDNRPEAQRVADADEAAHEQRAAAAAHNIKYARNNEPTPRGKVGDKVWFHHTTAYKRDDKIGKVTDQRSGPWVLTETNVNGNPTQARIRGVPLIVPGAAADAEPTRQWHELIVDVRQLAPYRLLPPRSDEQAADNITTLCLRQDDWTPEHELIISRRTASIVLASTPPKLRDKLRRELDKMIKKASEDNVAARA
jgi:hypothetical protein